MRLRRRKDTGVFRGLIVQPMLAINANMTVKELLDRHPGALCVFLERNMGCIGCPTEAYHTLADVARFHGVSLEMLLTVLEAAIQKGQ